MVLTKGEHPFIVRDSSVCYVDARLVYATDLDHQAAIGQIRTHAPCPLKTLENVRSGILASELTPQKVQSFYSETKKR
jgi:hypothetical protein